MKRAAGFMGLIFVLCLLVPARLGSARHIREQETMPSVPPETQAVENPPSPLPSTDNTVFVSVLHSDGEIRISNLATYLTGVLLGEMPMDFPLEARKAQAVVCRTYTLRRLDAGKHGTADICTDSSCCQAWRNPEDYGESLLLPAKEAIDATDGLVLTYEGKLIDATFFSCSGGRTEAAVEVWGTDIPYLQSVESPNEDAPYDEDSFEITAQELKDLLLSHSQHIQLGSDPAQWFSLPSSTKGGSVDTITVGGVVFTGKELRKLLGLRSTDFTVEVQLDTFTFTTRGFGHRVGMSQYGAKAMALEGSDCESILRHYYVGTRLERYSPVPQDNFSSGAGA